MRLHGEDAFVGCQPSRTISFFGVRNQSVVRQLMQ